MTYISQEACSTDLHNFSHTYLYGCCFMVLYNYILLYMHADLTVFIKESNNYLNEVVTEVHSGHSQRYILQISYGQQLNQILVHCQRLLIVIVDIINVIFRPNSSWLFHENGNVI